MDLVLSVPVDVVTWQDFLKRALVPLKWLAIIPLIAIGGTGGVGMGELLILFLVVLLLWGAANRRPPARCIEERLFSPLFGDATKKPN